MNRKMIISCACAGMMTLSACASMSDTERRTAGGAVIGGIAAGAISGEWGWAAVGAAVGAASGYIYDQHKKQEDQAYSQGAQDARSR